MTVWDLPGQAQAADVLRRAAAAREVSHAWAFIGPPGVGQQEAGRALVAALNCLVTPEGCGECDICARAMRGAFPSLWEFAPSGQAHRVADVRESWLPAASQTSMGGWKVLHVAEADRLNEAAANAFLKGLEEPPERTVWLLDLADPEELPDTILSRCRVVRFAPWGLDELRAHAAALGLAPEDVELAARLAQGAPRAIERFAGGGLDDVRAHRALYRRLLDQGQGVALLAAREVDDELKRRTAALKAAGKDEITELDDLYAGSVPRGVVKQVEERLAREERDARAGALQGVLDDLLTWTRDALLLAVGGAAADVLHVDAAEALRQDAQALGPKRLLRAAELTQRAKEDLELNLQQALALEALFLDLAVLAMTSPEAMPPLAAPRRR